MKPRMSRMKPKSAAGPAEVNLAEMERLLEFMSEHDLEEFEYAKGDFHVRLKKPGAVSPAPARAALPEVVYAEPPRSGASAAAATREEAAAGVEEGLHVVKSPIVGTFYGSPNPTADPFVKVGDRVEVGQVLCIVEAMKLMNEIECDVAGEVVSVLAENGQPVEYGESLFAIRPGK